MCRDLCVLAVCFLCHWCFFFFKQKTAYAMRISDWSSDVCSSDLLQIEADACAAIEGDIGADVEGAFADDVVAGLKCGGAVASPGDAAAIAAGLDRRAALEGCVGEVAGRVAVQTLTAGIIVAVGVLVIAGVVLRRRRGDIDGP